MVLNDTMTSVTYIFCMRFGIVFDLDVSFFLEFLFTACLNLFILLRVCLEVALPACPLCWWRPDQHVNFKSSNKYLQIFQQLKVPTDIYKSSNNKTVPTEIYKSSNKYLQIFQQLKVPTDIYKSSNKYLQIFQQISTNLPTINDTNKNLPVPPYTDPELPSTN